MSVREEYLRSKVIMTIETSNLRKVIRELIRNSIHSSTHHDVARALMLQEISEHISEYASSNDKHVVDDAIEEWIKNEAYAKADTESRRRIAHIAIKKFPPII